ncbi:MAG: hypothetical protein AAF438_17505 [Pseudomonadota bacterium]
MDRSYIVQNQIVERYLNGSLNTHEAEEFEAFYLHDQDTLEDLQAAQLLKQGLQDTVGQNRQATPPGQTKPRRIMPTLAASVAVVAGVSSFVWLSSELGNKQETIDHLTERLVTLAQPTAGIVPHYLEATRSSDGNVTEIRFTEKESQVVFALEVAPPDETNYTVRLSDNLGKEIWRQGNIATNDEGEIIVSVHSNGLNLESTYQWEVLVERDSVLVTFQSYLFELAEEKQ